MKKGIVYKLIYGKDDKEDFSSQNLPKTRTRQFFYAYKTRFGKIFRVNLIAALFAIPLFAWDLIATAYVSDFMKELDAATQFSYLLKMSLLQYATEIPLIMLSFVGLAGAYYAIRKICWRAPLRLIRDFNAGIKGSYKQFLLLGLLMGIVNFIVNYLFNFSLLTISQKTEFWNVLAISGVVVAAVICFSALMFAMTQSSLYNLSFGKLIKNSFILTFKRLWRSAGIALLSVIPFLLFKFMPWAFMQIIGVCLAVVFSIGYAVTLQTVYCHGVFDVYINAATYPDFVGVGLSSGKNYFQILCDSTELDGESDVKSDVGDVPREEDSQPKESEETE